MKDGVSPAEPVLLLATEQAVFFSPRKLLAERDVEKVFFLYKHSYHHLTNITLRCVKHVLALVPPKIKR